MKPEDRKRILERFASSSFYDAFEDFINEKIEEIREEGLNKSDDFSQVIGARLAVDYR